MSGQILYDAWIFQLYNLCYTSLPIIAYALMDEEFQSGEFTDLKTPAKNKLEDMPSFYLLGQSSKLFNTVVFWQWIFKGSWQALIITYFSLIALDDTVAGSEGKATSFYVTGMAIFTYVVIICNLEILAFSNLYNGIIWFLAIASVLFYFFSMWVASYFKILVSYLLIQIMLALPNFYISMILIIAYTYLIDLALFRFNKQIEYESMQEVVKDEKKKMSALKTYKTLDDKVKQRMIESGSVSRSLGLKRLYTGFAFSGLEPIEQFHIQNYQN
eukprot:TRINITY_DN1608_c0_g1_i3.p1 TRINITY_DN1608_c0_g1~~TRINITY_DN1608_c0_g1_i3.p1  ORF type:complete len:272 (-),score=25.12 TRINITY_DN1608_c0_g1_i3:223-1038(-)